MSFGPQPIAKNNISFEDYEKSGCPVCNTGEKIGFALVRTQKEILFRCAHCGVSYRIRASKCPDRKEG